jgi:hypothetical protein
MEPIGRHSRERVCKRGCSQVGKSPHWSSHVGISLKILIDHWVSPTRSLGVTDRLRGFEGLDFLDRFDASLALRGMEAVSQSWHGGCMDAE